MFMHSPHSWLRAVYQCALCTHLPPGGCQVRANSRVALDRSTQRLPARRVSTSLRTRKIFLYVWTCRFGKAFGFCTTLLIYPPFCLTNSRRFRKATLALVIVSSVCAAWNPVSITPIVSPVAGLTRHHPTRS